MFKACLIVPFLALPLAAQEAEPPSLMERGLKLFLEGMLEEMEPTLRDLEDLAEDAKPFLEDLQEELNDTFDDLNAFHPPEVLPNGDIILRRKDPLIPEGPVEPNADGSIDL